MANGAAAFMRHLQAKQHQDLDEAVVSSNRCPPASPFVLASHGAAAAGKWRDGGMESPSGAASAAIPGRAARVSFLPSASFLPKSKTMSGHSTGPPALVESGGRQNSE